MAKQLEDQAQRIINYCNTVEHYASLDEVNWGNIALPVVAEDVGVLALTCVKHAVKLDILIKMAREIGNIDPTQG